MLNAHWTAKVTEGKNAAQLSQDILTDLLEVSSATIRKEQGEPDVAQEEKSVPGVPSTGAGRSA